MDSESKALDADLMLLDGWRVLAASILSYQELVPAANSESDILSSNGSMVDPFAAAYTICMPPYCR